MKHLIILIGCCAMSASYAYSIRQPAEILHVYEGRTQYVRVNACELIGKAKQASYYGANVQLAAAIPATALRRVK